MPGSKARVRTPTTARADTRVAKATAPGSHAPQLNPVEREVIQLQRDAGNHAVTLALQRQASLVVQRDAAEAGYKILAQGWQYAGRDIVVVATGRGDQVLFFYRRTGKGAKGAGVAVAPGKWAPFKGFMAQDASIIGREIEVVGTKESHRLADRNYVNPKTEKVQVANPKEGWFNKQSYYSKVHKDDPLRGYGNQRNKSVGKWLDKQNLEPGTATRDWQAVEQQMDEVANRHRAQTRMKGKPTHVGARHGPIAGSEPVRGPEGGGSGGSGGGGAKAGSEAKAAGTEAKAVGTEAKAIGAEVKAVKAEVAGVEIASGAAKASKAARLGKLLLALALPGPLDVFFLFISAFASIAEAKAKLRADAYATGFAQGLAAAVTWISPEDAKDLLMFKVANPSIGERVAGFEGVRERGTNEGVAAGWKFGANLNTEQRKGFRRESLSIAGLKEKRRYSRDNYIEMGAALRPTVVELLEEAARQEREKEARAVLAAQQAAGGWRPPM